MELSYNFNELVRLVYRVVKAGRVPAIWGPPGIGKSQLCKVIAQNLSKDLSQNVDIYVLDAPLLQPFDYTVGVPNHEKRCVELYPTGFLPQKGPALVCVEDLPHAKKYQQVPLMPIVLDHRIGPLKFSDDVWFIITGNPPEYAETVELDPPLLNRLVHFNMQADVDNWREWAKAYGIDERIVDFVYAYPQYLSEPPKTGVKAWPTPRSWHMLADCIKSVTDEDEIRSLSLATVGTGVTSIFISWLKYLRDIDTSAILEKGEIPQYKDRAQLFAIVSSVTSRIKTLKPNLIKNYIHNIIKFWKSLDGDYKISFLKELIIYHPDGKKDLKYIQALASLPESKEMSQYVFQIMKG